MCRPVSRDDALLLRTVRCPLISLVFASTSRALAVRSVRSVPSTRRCCARLPACKLATARCARLQRASRWSIARVVIIVRVRELDKIFAESGPSKGPPKSKTAAQAPLMGVLSFACVGGSAEPCLIKWVIKQTIISLLFFVPLPSLYLPVPSQARDTRGIPIGYPSDTHRIPGIPMCPADTRHTRDTHAPRARGWACARLIQIPVIPVIPMCPSDTRHTRDTQIPVHMGIKNHAPAREKGAAPLLRPILSCL